MVVDLCTYKFASGIYNKLVEEITKQIYEKVDSLLNQVLFYLFELNLIKLNLIEFCLIFSII